MELMIRLTDYALQMAYGNFSAALMHVGGQNVYYNVSQTDFAKSVPNVQPFTPPPTNLSTLYQWTTGSVYYSSLIVAEAFGSSNQSRIVDMSTADNSSIYHPTYAIYENNVPSRLVLFNFVNDQSGASDLQTTINLNGGNLPATVSVHYFRAPSIAEQNNLTWAGQTMGSSFASDGRLQGALDTVTINCNNNACVIPVYAPSIALVFLTDTAFKESSVQNGATLSYATTVVGTGSATYDPGALQSSNGQNGPDGVVGSNSKGSVKSGARRRLSGEWASVVLGLLGIGLLRTL